MVEREEELRQKQNATFDQRHRVRGFSQVLPGDLVRIFDRREQGTVDEIASWSYEVEAANGMFGRDIIHPR